MGRVREPTTLSSHFGLDPDRLGALGVLDVTLGVDTKLFVDPLLLGASEHSEISGDAVRLFRSHFERVIKLLAASASINDVAWRNARRLLEFHEIPSTCLGYGASIHGSGFGRDLTETILRTAKEIVDLGIRDPDLFVALALFEEGIGPDRISDMTTNVVLPAFLEFNRRATRALGVPTRPFLIGGVRADLVRNPTITKPTPVLLLPTDILRKLPIATCWDEISDAASKNDQLREKVNRLIAHIWEAKSKRDKALLRLQAMSSRHAFETLMESIHEVPPSPYNLATDPDGLHRWAGAALEYTLAFPLTLPSVTPASPDDVLDVVHAIAVQFRDLVEKNGLSKELWVDGKPRHESHAQRLFFAVAHSYCRANNLDISPEADAGAGPVDFKFSHGFSAKVVVEVKLSTNTRLVPGYERQLEAYKAAEKTFRGIYLVIDVGSMGKKDEQLLKIRNEAVGSGEPASEVFFIDGMVPPPASKR